MLNFISLPAVELEYFITMVKAASVHDEHEYRFRAGRKAAEVLADALYTLFRMGEGDR